MAFQYYAPPGRAVGQVNVSTPNAQLNPWDPSVPRPGQATTSGISGNTGGLSSWATNPLAQAAQQGPNIWPSVAQNEALAQKLETAFEGNLPYAQQALELSFDPQQALFKQRQQDLIDASRAAQAARGIAMSPYGASIEAGAVGRFYNDWQNEQIQRMYVGTQAATGLQKTYADALMGAANIRDNLIKDMLQEYGLRGDRLRDAMQSVLGALDIEAKVAMAGLDAQTRRDVATTAGSAQVAGESMKAGAQVASTAISAAGKGGGGGGGGGGG